MDRPPERTRPGAQPAPPASEQTPEEEAATRRYLELIRSVHEEWADLEQRGDPSAQLSAAALSTIKESVRADVRHGAHVAMPPTPAGPFTVSELALRTLVRRAVDAVPGVLALRTTVEHDPERSGPRSRGLPRRIRSRISVSHTTPDLPALAGQVRASISAAYREHLGDIVPVVDIHIEDLHET